MHTYNIIDGIKDNENIYLVEDDYLHTLDAITVLNEGIDKFGMVSCYDHPINFTDVPERFGLTKSSHWRTVDVTTQTFGVSRQRYEQIKTYLRMYTDDITFFRKCHNDLGLRLWSCIPGRSTHLNKDLLSPYTDWESVNNNSKEV